MLLKSFKYVTKDWTLDQLVLGKSNLIVGKNASGKSRALRALESVKALLSQRNAGPLKGSYSTEIVFADDYQDEINLSLTVDGKKVVKEVLKINDRHIINRQEGVASIDNEKVNPPEDMLLMHVRRDTEKYPVIEKIIKWAEDAVIRSFIDREKPSQNELFELVSKFTPEMKSDLRVMANKVGFPLTLIDTFDGMLTGYLKDGLGNFKLIVVQENNVVPMLRLEDLSSGMYRTVLLLILIEQLIHLQQPTLLAIDDLGEGLDYLRATNLGKLLFDICEKKNVQLIATSNEEFMMNIVDISKWNILVREGDTVRSITASLCPSEFEDFKFMGLSNFDFFTSDFLNRISAKLFDEKK